MGYTRLTPSLSVVKLTSSSRTVAAGRMAVVDFDMTRNGYTALGIVGAGGTSNGGSWGIGYMSAMSSVLARVVMWNMTSSSVTDTFWVSVLYVKE